MSSKPKVLVLGGNFAGLGTAQKIRQFAGDSVDITVVDRKNYLLFIPNIPADVFENSDPASSQRMDLIPVLAKDHIQFVQGDVTGIDVDNRSVHFTPSERPGGAPGKLDYDYLVIALGNRLAFEKIEGFAEYGDSVSDLYLGNRLREKLWNGGYQGGPIAIGSARFHQGDGAEGLEPYPGGSIPNAVAACEGPPVEVMLSAATYLKKTGQGGPEKITVFTPGELIAEDAGEQVVGQLLDIASGMGFNYVNNAEDIRRITAEGVELANGQTIEAELKIIFPDWVAHDFMRDLPITDSEGFVVTDLLMKNPKYPEIFAAGDAAAVTVPKLGAIGHQECEIVGRQIALAVGRMSEKAANTPLQPVVNCIGDMGDNQAFYIRSNSWYGGSEQVLKMGHIPFLLKMQYKNLFFRTQGKVPDWGLDFSKLMAEKLSA
ncbi:pyridine nucleotide-disulfide oxidoreductase [Halothiobacillus diazotrophicus]|uniref:Pyridine nucleotide-disulfide oxidoreductase n=1 Tax=Halothiobacillus diazotrophicus TaxID=1860122 RepID=A0A191ZEV2_9GAMM|nr:FAD-dependent oxidoreductase [Halothiobacillus diazotrophicus]ANJ66406.1 pyridine nucleotide-disulfide oxidoreductase [Halothiobacillus diazotrophicus]